MLATCLRTRLRDPRCSGRGTPWIDRGSFISDGSSIDGIRVVTARYSPGNLALGTGTDAVRHIWSLVSLRNGGTRAAWLLPAPGPELVKPCDARIVERRDRLLNPDKPGRPRAFFARMISSKRRIAAWPAGCVSLSWMNSLKASNVSTGSYMNTK